MYTVIGNDITISSPTAEIVEYCKNNLVVDNPDFYKKEKMGRWTGNTPRQIFLYEISGTDLRLPFGELRNIWRYIHDKPYKLKFRDLRQVDYNSHIKLYDYQKRALNKALTLKNGVIVMPCGSGKTQTGLEIIARLGGKALWLTHTQDLLNQSMSRAKDVFGNQQCFGTITAGKVNIGSGITFATVQTMVNLDLSKYKNEWDIIVVDECHKAIGSPTKVMQFYKVVSSLCCRYKFGLTATPYRNDRLEVSMFALIGNIIHEVNREEVERNTCAVEVKKIDTGYEPKDMYAVTNSDGTLNYGKLIDDLIHDDDRYEKVLSVLRNIPYPNSTMVFANRVEYLQRLCNDYNDCGYGRAICLSGAGNSKKAKEERKRALKALNVGELDCIFATYQLAKEGLDVPNLRYLVMATPEKDQITVTQSAGRVARIADGKEKGVILDLVDDFGIYRGWSKKRDKIYKNLNFIFT